ncbi:hypothetical protein BBJ29_004876 [Phytophthora kernoviae]|uniref:protein O-GlcNAc transferase n=1 Tax=Phytophthora kernoviae TaxID=325452 RepID=A0A3F2S0B4_9STRA|nr:hypothetical protein BBP00_00001945 [Phytophthora kernoviae]RLN67876.1 hypothetical protein BBJ29_004876 [Phytophthora kernoviae]
MYFRWLLVFLALTSLQLILCVSSGVDQLWQVADQLWRAKQLESTMEILLQIEALEPRSLPARIGQAAIYHEWREFDLALGVLSQVLVQEPRNPLVLGRVGEVYLGMHNSLKALEYFQAAEKEIDPRDTVQVDELTHQIALAYHRGGNFVMAETFFQRVSEHGRSAPFFFDFGVTLGKLGKAQAGKAYRHALQIDPTQSYARLNFAALHHLNPSAPPNIKLMAMGNVGAAYENMRDIMSALNWYERALLASMNVTYQDEFSARSDRLHLMVHVVRAKLSACVWANAEYEFDMLWEMVTSTQMSMGAPFVDYVVVDKHVVPPAELASAFTEKLVVMPNSYQVNYYEQVLVSAKKVSRRRSLWGRDEKKQEDHGFTFVNFNKIDKLETQHNVFREVILLNLSRAKRSKETFGERQMHKAFYAHEFDLCPGFLRLSISGATKLEDSSWILLFMVRIRRRPMRSTQVYQSSR